jgi:hypothetical protein
VEQPRIEGTAGTLHQVLVHDELGVVEDTRINPWQQGEQIGIAFVVGGDPNGAIYHPFI